MASRNHSVTALLVIDMQVGLLDGAYDEEGVIERIESLIEAARAAGAPVVFMQHDHVAYEPLMPGRSTWEIHPQLAPQPEEVVVHKSSSDAFLETNLAEVLRDLKVDRIVIGGMQSEFCVDATARAAASRGFDVVLLADGHTTGDTDELSAEQIIAHHNYALENLACPSHPIRVQRAAAIRWHGDNL